MRNARPCSLRRLGPPWLALLVASTGSSPAESVPRSARTIGVAVIDRVGLSDRAHRFLQAELERSFAGSEVELRVARLAPGCNPVRSPEIATFTVQLWPTRGTFLRASPTAMGAVRVHEGRLLDGPHVFVPVVVETMSRGRETFADLTDQELGRGLARVVAHELVHALAPRAPHSRHGILQEGLTREQLRGRRPIPIGRRVLDAMMREGSPE